jgi:hypothetical protein
MKPQRKMKFSKFAKKYCGIDLDKQIKEINAYADRYVKELESRIINGEGDKEPIGLLNSIKG